MTLPIPEKLKPDWCNWMTLRMFYAAKRVVELTPEPSDPVAKARFHELARAVGEFQVVLDEDVSLLFANMKAKP